MSRVHIFRKLGAALLLWSVVASGQSGAAVSAWELRHPVPGKAMRFLRKALGEITYATPDRVTSLRRGLKDPDVAPYALKALGALHLEEGQWDASVTELREAARMLPSDPSAHGLLAYAHFGSGAYEAAEEEAQRALRMNRREPTANLVMGLLGAERIREQGGSVLNVLASDVPARLRAAAATIPGAWLILWSYHRAAGQSEAAEGALAAYRRREVALTPEARGKVDEWLAERNLPPILRDR